MRFKLEVERKKLQDTNKELQGRYLPIIDNNWKVFALLFRYDQIQTQ